MKFVRAILFLSWLAILTGGCNKPKNTSSLKAENPVASSSEGLKFAINECVDSKNIVTKYYHNNLLKFDFKAEQVVKCEITKSSGGYRGDLYDYTIVMEVKSDRADKCRDKISIKFAAPSRLTVEKLKKYWRPELHSLDLSIQTLQCD